jgi:hypothetical protein
MNKVRPIDPNTLSYQNISPEDTVLFDSFEVTSLFNPTQDIVEYYVYDLNNELIYQDLNFTNWSNTEDPSLASTTPSVNATGSSQDGITTPNLAQISTINLDPTQDLQNVGLNFGKVKPVYNFVTYRLNSNPNNQYFISDISSDRTELRLKSNFISDDSLQISFEQFQTDFLNSSEFDEFYLNFGDNKYVVAINAAIDNVNNPFSILIKLYEPLPQEFGVKSTCYVVTKNGESVAYEVEFDDVLILEDTSIYIGPPNINLDVLDQISPATTYKNYDEITATDLSGSYNQLINFLSGSNIGININVNYDNYSNFVFFSSAQQRLNNFVTKLTNISSSQADLNLIYNNITGSTSGSSVVLSNKVLLEKQIEDEISTFDPYEQYLYYQSGSYTWPKSNDTLPYVLYDVNSATGQAWYTTQSVTASNYDTNNQNYLYWLVPEYLRTNDNDNYFLFIDMVGQLFDQIWLYTGAVTDKLEAYPGLNLGVSKDIVADVIESLGTKLYSSNFTTENIYNSLLGLSPTGSILLPTGSKLVTTYVTSSTEEQYIPTIDDYHKLTYKKIYHALPYLLKTKGTVNGVKTLLNIFGVPDTILRVNEYGGKDKNINTWDSWQDEFNYAYFTSGSYFVSSSFILNSVWGTENNRPQSVEFRFQTTDIPTNIGYYSQSLWSTNDGAGSGVSLILRYTGSAYSSGSYSGSIPNPYNHYALLEFIPDVANTNVSASVYLPFYDGGWWSVLINKDNNNPNYTLFAKNKLYSGSNGNIIGFQASSSVTASTENPWIGSEFSYFGTASLGPRAKIFSGSFQEIRYYTKALGENAFDAYVMNPYSIEEDDYLAFRAPLGGELYTGSTSVHPKVTGSWVATSSFNSDSIFYISNTSSFNVNREFIFFDQFAVGIQNNISNKIDDENIILPFYDITFNNIPNNTILSSTVTIQQNFPISQSYTENVNYAEIALSPQNEINEDINSSIGYFNIGELIGDPRQISSSAVTYPDLDVLRDAYFEKYVSNYNWIDFINLISYFDNSLFKMLKDFVPARTALASGIVIKQTLLERNKYPVPQVDTFTTTSYYGSGSQPNTNWNTPIGTQNILFSGSILTTLITGSSGGSVPEMGSLTSSLGPGFNIVPITQSWSGTTPSLSGSVSFTSSYQYEFFNGEFSGSNLVVTNGDLSDCAVNINEIYSTGSVGYTFVTIDGLPYGPILNDGAEAFQRIYNRINYDVDIENTYYISFTIDTNVDDPIGGTVVVQLKDNSGKVFYTSPSLAAGDTASVNQLQISNPVFPLYFFANTDVYDVRAKAINIILYEDQLNDLEGDCEPLLNNVLTNRPNPYYMDLDFSTNPYIAVNTQTVLSGSATRFAIPQSDYTSLKHANPRYFGSTTISPGFGQAIFKNPAQLPFANKSEVLSNADLYQDLKYGNLNSTSLFNTGSQVPNVENYARYFCYFNTITDSSPEYPSGSNLNLIYIVDENGSAYGLSNQNSDSQQINDYLYIISNLFPSNSKPYILPVSGSNISTSNLLANLPVVEGGARYQTIFAKTGSSGNFTAFWSGSDSSPIYVPYFHSQSISSFDDTGSIFKPWLYPLLTFTDPISGSIADYDFNFLNVYNPNTNETILTGSGILPTDTLFPLQKYDFIRIANTGSTISSSLDGTFSALGLYQIKDIFTGSAVPVQTSSLSIVPFMNNTTAVATATGGDPDYQRFRVFRRIPTQTNVLIGTIIPGLTEGLLIPENYNPNLNPTNLAKIAGII